MNLTTKILEVLKVEGELFLEELVRLIPKKTNDHRNLYPLASLISLGYIEDDMMASIEEKKKENIHLIAYKLYAWSVVDGNFSEYKGISWRTSDSRLKDQVFAITGEGYLYLERELTRNGDRRFTILLAILSAVLGSSLTALISNSIGSV